MEVRVKCWDFLGTPVGQGCQHESTWRWQHWYSEVFWI